MRRRVNQETNKWPKSARDKWSLHNAAVRNTEGFVSTSSVHFHRAILNAKKLSHYMPRRRLGGYEV
jgi:hypothetical protein